jgi:hypothetical protein
LEAIEWNARFLGKSLERLALQVAELMLDALERGHEDSGVLGRHFHGVEGAKIRVRTASE